MDALFPGLKALLNYHPLFVHFPIALWTAALLFEIAALALKQEALHRASCSALALGALAAVAAVFSGWSAQGAVPQAGGVHEVMELHENLMISASILSGILAAFGLFVLPRKSGGGMRAAFVTGLVVLVGLMALGADRGAQLVYQFGTGVDWATAQKQK
ncbi:MAG TPA: DUF2231 domain-containing protein [Candidatus Solibacter sp.]|nr:DUF2231 domain-containing protein [Candidatus Solibacter sp.]